MPASAQRPLPEHVYYVHELVGCAVWTAAGERVGEVAAVDGEGGATRLVVRAAGGSEVLVPFVQAFCTVDLSRPADRGRRRRRGCSTSTARGGNDARGGRR